MIAFIDDNCELHGVEPICTVFRTLAISVIEEAECAGQPSSRC
jgi:hypothetical protein